MTTQIDQDLLQKLMQQQNGQQPKQQKNVNKLSALDTIFWTVVGEAIVPATVGAAFWLLGASWTIYALMWLAGAFVPVGDSVLWYLLPLLFSGAEVALWKLQMRPIVRRLALGMAALDLLSTTGGLFLAITQSYIPRLSDIVTIQPSTSMNIIIVLLAAVGAWWITFSPEKYLINAFAQIVEIVKFFRS